MARWGTLLPAPAPVSRKAANLRGNPHVVLTTGCSRWESGLDVAVGGAFGKGGFSHTRHRF